MTVFLIGKSAPKSQFANQPFEFSEVMESTPNKGDIIQIDGTDDDEHASLFVVDGIVWKKGKDIQIDHFERISDEHYYPLIMLEFVK